MSTEQVPQPSETRDMSDGRPTPQVFGPPSALRPGPLGRRYVVSAGHPLVADVAARVFDRGGNAVDAAAAAGLAAGVVQADMCNLGGVAPILVRPAGRDEVYSVAGLGWWGRSATLEAYRARHGDEMSLTAAVGVVPSAISAWVRALQRFGTWTFADCAAPAIELARDGFPIDERLAEALVVLGATFKRWSSSREVYWPSGAAPVAGELLVQEALGRLLERLCDAEHGDTREAALDAVHDAFYRGEIAARIVECAQSDGGWLDRDDLADFDAEIEPAVGRSFADWHVHTPDTWCQGPALLQVLGILDPIDLRELGHNSAAYVHLLAEATKLAFFDRERFYGDPSHVDVPLQSLLSNAHADELRAAIRPDRALPSFGAGGDAREGRFDTTYLCTMDADGTVCSATPSDTLEEAPLIPDLGIFISPRGVQSRLDPKHPARLGPRRRPRLTPAPAIALGPREADADDRRAVAFGCPGGDVILQGMLQGFLNVAAFGMSAQEAVEAPRFAAFAWPDSFYPHAEVAACVAIESRFADSVPDELEAIGHRVWRWPNWEFDAGAVAIALDALPPRARRRTLSAGADPRRSGYALGR